MSENKKIRTIAIDDDPVALLAIKKIIANSDNMELINAYSNPIEGAAGLILDKPDLLFLDINMPEFDGLEILKSIVNPPKVVVVSANAKYEEEALKLKANAFIEKPAQQQEVFDKVASLFSEKA